MEKNARPYWNPEMETLDREKMEQLQWERLQKQLVHVFTNSPFYGKVYREKGFDPQKIKSMEEFKAQCPIVTKNMIRQFRGETGDPFGGICCVGKKQLVWIGSSTGTSGQPTFVAMTEEDMDIHAEWGARVLWQTGVRPGGKAHIASSPWTKGYHTFEQGAKRMGCTYLPEILFPSEAPRIVLTQKFFQPDTYFVMTTALLTMFNAEITKQQWNSREVWSSCKSIMWGGEPVTTVTRKRLGEEWNTQFVLFHGPGSDFGLPPLECRETQNGGHIQEDLYFAEVLDPLTQQPLPPGEEGHLVWTHLLDQATPLVRFDSEDMGILLDDPCPCGRTGRRVILLDRPENGIKVQQRWVFSLPVREILESCPETEEGVFQFVKYAQDMDRLRLRVGYRPEITPDLQELKKRLEDTLSKSLGFDTDVELTRKEEFRTIAHKFVRILDLTSSQ